MHRPVETLPTRHRLKLLLALAGSGLPAWAAAQVGPAAAEAPGEPPTPAVYEAIRPSLASRYGDVDSVVVLQRGQRVFEHHRPGSGPDALRDVHSVTKSVLALLVGQALDQGALRSLDQPLGEAWLAAAGTRAAAVTWRHLLTMTAGFEPQLRFTRQQGDDPDHLLQRALVAPPGSRFAYDNLATNLLAIALAHSVGEPLPAYAARRLFGPLGITRFDWPNGTNGHALGFSGLRLRTADMARIGQLMLQGGRWQGQPLLNADFAAAAVRAQNTGGPPVGLSYGYLWWLAPTPAADGRLTFLASGYGGQFIWVHPPLELVVAATSTVSDEGVRRGQALTLIRQELFRAALAHGSAR